MEDREERQKTPRNYSAGRKWVACACFARALKLMHARTHAHTSLFSTSLSRNDKFNARVNSKWSTMTGFDFFHRHCVRACVCVFVCKLTFFVVLPLLFPSSFSLFWLPPCKMFNDSHQRPESVWFTFDGIFSKCETAVLL